MPLIEDEETTTPAAETEQSTTDTTETATTDAPADEATAYDPYTNGLEDVLADDADPLGEKAAASEKESAEAAARGELKADSLGRFHRPDGTVMSKAEVEAFRAKQAADVAIVAPVVEAPKGPEPWTPNIYGHEIAAIPGALVDPASGNVLIPKDQVGQLTKQLAYATKYPEVQTLRQERAVEQARQQFIGEQWGEFLKNTMLNPQWMEQATMSAETYAIAQREVKVQLQELSNTATEKFGQMPKTTAPTDADVAPLDQMEAVDAVSREITDLIAAEYHSVLSASDVPEILKAIGDEHLFVQQKDGWHIDTAPIRRELRVRAAEAKAAKVTAAQPTVDAAARRNASAVPAPVPSATKPAPKKQPPAPKAEEPPLSLYERKQAYYKNLGIRAPG